MNVRNATSDDFDGIHTVARRSFQSSYALSPREIDTILTTEFSPEALGGRIDDDSVTLFVVEDDLDTGPAVDVSGFAELDDDGTLNWLHVHPEARGSGIGTALLERVERELESKSQSLTATVLERASEGGQFLERAGLSRSGNSSMEVGGGRFHLQEYATTNRERTPNEPTVDVPDSVQVDGQCRTIDRETDFSGTLAPFYRLHEADGERPSDDPAIAEKRIGFFCSQCGAIDVSADGMERLVCNECGNLHRPDDWDPSYL